MLAGLDVGCCASSGRFAKGLDDSVTEAGDPGFSKTARTGASGVALVVVGDADNAVDC